MFRLIALVLLACLLANVIGILLMPVIIAAAAVWAVLIMIVACVN